MFCVFTVVQKYLQIPVFQFYGHSVCSLLFRGVVVKLSSASDLHRPGQAIQQLSSSYLQCSPKTLTLSQDVSITG
jgi:hypothetical protein